MFLQTHRMTSWSSKVPSITSHHHILAEKWVEMVSKTFVPPTATLIIKEWLCSRISPAKRAKFLGLTNKIRVARAS